MKIVNELKKLPTSDLAKVINQEVSNERKSREKELNGTYLKRHPEIDFIIESIRDSNKEFAVHYTLGGLQALLHIAIIDLQYAEAELKALKIQHSK